MEGEKTAWKNKLKFFQKSSWQKRNDLVLYLSALSEAPERKAKKHSGNAVLSNFETDRTLKIKQRKEDE